MKGLLLMILLFSFLEGESQEKLKPIVEIETGVARRKVFLYHPKWEHISPRIEQKSLYSNFVLGASYKGFAIKTQTYTYFYPNGGYTFRPWLGVYETSFSYTYKNFQFGAMHDCRHLIKSGQFPDMVYGGGKEHIYVRWKIK